MNREYFEAQLPEMRPEDKFFYGDFNLYTVVDKAECMVLMGALLAQHRGDSRSTRGVHNRVLQFDREGKLLDHYDKMVLVPFGEYVPGQEWFPAVRKWIRENTPLGAIPSIAKGDRISVMEINGIRFGSQVCYDVAYPGPTRDYAREGCRFQVNVSNEGWYRDGAALDLLVQMCQLRAVESRSGFVRATNTGISCFIDPFGRVEAILTDETGRDREIEGFLRKNVTLGPSNTVYSGIGDLFSILCMWFLLLVFGLRMVTGILGFVLRPSAPDPA
jgi:apolipoprotein N-acyltransferase